MKSFLKSKAWLISVAATVACGCIGGIVANAIPVQADETEALLKTVYEIGETVEVPTAEITYGDKTVESADYVVYFPDGSASKQASFDIEAYGKYTVRYSANIDGKNVYAEKSFTVEKEVVSFNNENSKYSYGKNEEYKQGKGLSISINAGDEARINKIIDLSNTDFSESFIDFAFTPVTFGIADAYCTFMKVTDAYDEDNYFIVRMQNWSDFGAWADGYCYMDARAPGQEWTTCIEKKDNHHKRGETGKGWYMTYLSMTGRDGNTGERRYDTVRVFYDAAKKQLVTNSNAYGSACMTDFDDAEWYDLTEEKLWDGFTTGEAYVSFYADRMNANTLNLHVTKLGGFRLDGLAETEADEGAPIISVDYAGQNENALPYAVVGKKYNVYDAVGLDLVDGKINVISNVYYDYNGNRCIVDVADGAFTPTKTGTYTIVYAATDKTGNVSYKTVDVLCKGTADKVTVSVDGEKTSGLTGQMLSLYNGFTVEGCNGTYTVSASIELNGEKTELDIANPVFTPLIGGDYTVAISVSDYVSTHTYEYTLSVADNPNAVFTEEALVPKYLIKGVPYEFDQLPAWKLQNGVAEEVLTEIYVTGSDGLPKKIDGAYTATEAGTIKLSYMTMMGGVISSVDYEIPVVDVGYGEQIKLEGYFYDAKGNVTVSVEEEYIQLCTEKDSTVDFVKPVQALELDMTLNVNKDFNNFDSFYVLLTDSENEDIQLKATYEKQDGKTYFYLNNDKVYKTLNANFDETATENFTLGYNQALNALYGANEVWFTPTEDLAGNEFNGFPSGKAYITVGFNGVDSLAKIKLYNINNQTLYNFKKDTAKPQIIADAAIGQVAAGEIVTISPAMLDDVLDPVLQCSLTVTDPNGNVVKAIDGTLLDGTCDVYAEYQIKVDEYGEYFILYEAKDSTNSRSTMYSYGFTVIDLVSPEVDFETKVVFAKVGDTVKVATPNISDNFSTNFSIYYSVM